jgi:FKBP-type peptidyl-prolyl cis-trans isomerase
MKKKIIIGVIIIIIIVDIVIAIAPGDMKFIDSNPKPSQVPKTQTAKLEIKDLKTGIGAVVKNGDTVIMNYKGSLTDGKEFDSSYKRNQPFKTVIGTGQVIKGWDLGILGMKIGGKRRLVIPPDLAYGKQGAPPTIPPNATLIFEVELLEIK